MHALRIPDVAQRDRFFRRTIVQRSAYAVRSDGMLATVPSPQSSGRHSVLFWSARVEALRWAPMISLDGNVEELSIDALLTSIPEELLARGAIAGVDWTADPIEVELEASDFATRLRVEILQSFLARVRSTGGVWLLHSDSGPVRAESGTRPEASVLPCWSDIALAQVCLVDDWNLLTPKLMPVETFATVALPWLSEHGWAVSPEHSRHSAVLEIGAADLIARLAGR